MPTPIRPKEEIDTHVGMMVRTRRLAMDCSQRDLAEVIGVSVSQVVKYERGQSRIGASTLFRIAEFLNTPIDAFFHGIDDRPTPPSPDPLLNQRETLDLVAAYYRIPTDNRRKRFRELLLAIAKAAGE